MGCCFLKKAKLHEETWEHPCSVKDTLKIVQLHRNWLKITPGCRNSRFRDITDTTHLMIDDANDVQTYVSDKKFRDDGY